MRYLLRRLGFFVLTLWAALTLNFFVPRLMPGSPVDALRTRTRNRLSQDALEQLLTSFGFKPNANLFSQYLDYLGNMFTGRWGVSVGASLGQPITQIIAQALPWTLGLVGVATVIAFLLGTLIGTIAGWRRGGVLDSRAANGLRDHLRTAVLLGGAAADPVLLGVDRGLAAA